MGHIHHQEPPGTQQAEPGAGGQPGTPGLRRLLGTQGVGLPGGRARRKPAAQTCEERLLKTLGGAASTEEVLRHYKQVFI